VSVIADTIAVYHNLGAISSIHAIMDTRTFQGAIAWAVSLNTFPYLAVPAPFRLELCSIKAIESMDRWERPR
jgi:hypothetical protein